MPQGSILGSLLFLIYINDLHVAIKYSEVHHFADDTNLLNFNNCVKSINKRVIYDLKNLPNWLKTNKIYLNVTKTELVLFTSSKKQLDCDLKIKLNGKRLYETDSVRYLGIQIDKRLTWKQKINHVALKLSKANAMLSKLRHVLDIKTLRLWGQSTILYLSPICAMLHLFEHETLIQLKGFTYYRKNPSEYCSSKLELPIQVLYLKCPKFLSPLIHPLGRVT